MKSTVTLQKLRSVLIGKHWLGAVLRLLVGIIVIGYCLPDRPVIPVQGATAKDWNPRSFWYDPWGASGVHKGVDIFAAGGVPVLTSSGGWVLITGDWGNGGRVALCWGQSGGCITTPT